MASRSIIIDLQDTDKSRYFAITEFNNCFIIRSCTEFVFLMNILGKRSNLPFSRKSDRKKEKSTVSFTHEQNIICSQTQLDGIAHEQTIICRQLFAGHVVGSRQMKRKKNLLRMIILINKSSKSFRKGKLVFYVFFYFTYGASILKSNCDITDF